MNYRIKTAIALSAFSLTIASTQAALIAYEGFDYATAGMNTGLEGKGTGTDFAGAWADLGTSNVRNGVFADSLTVSSDIALAATGNHARGALASTGNGIARLFSSTQGTDGTSVWMSFRTQNNNTSTAEEFAPIFTTKGGNRSTLFGATRTAAGQSASDGQFDLANGNVSSDIAARDTNNHFLVAKFDFGIADADTVTVWWDPTSATDFGSTGNAQISVTDASFDGIGFTALNATLRLDEIYLGTTLADVTAVPEPSSTALLGLGGITLILRRRK